MKRLRGFNAVRGFGTSGSVTPIDPPDTVPDAYSFTDVTGAEPNTQTTSNAVTVTGINASTPVSVTGGQLSINGGAWATSGTVSDGDTLELRVTSSATFEGVVNVNVDIGGVLDTWTVTTRSDVTIQSLVESMPGYGTTLVGFWLPGHDPTNQTVKDWSGFGNDGLRGNSLTPNTSSPNGSSFDGDDFVQVANNLSLQRSQFDDVSFGVVINRQSNSSDSYAISHGVSGTAIRTTNATSGTGYVDFGTNFTYDNTLQQHIAVVGNGTAYRVRTFTNGVLQTSRNAGSGGYDARDDGKDLYLGVQDGGGLGLRNYYIGDLYLAYAYNADMESDMAQIDTTVNDILALV